MINNQKEKNNLLIFHKMNPNKKQNNFIINTRNKYKINLKNRNHFYEPRNQKCLKMKIKKI